MTAFNKIPLYDRIDLANAPPEVGELWERLARAENALAEKLKDLPEGTAVILDGKYAFFLIPAAMENDEYRRELVRADFDPVSKDASNLVSRCDVADLSWADVEEHDLVEAARCVEVASDGMSIDRINLQSEGYTDWQKERSTQDNLDALMKGQTVLL